MMRPNERALAIKDMTSFEWRGNASGKLDKVKGQQKLTFDKEPDYIYNKEGEIVGVDAWVRLFGADGKEVKIDPHRRIVNPPTVPRSGITTTETGKRDTLGRAIKNRELAARPLDAFYEAVWDSVTATPNATGWRTRGTVTTVFSGVEDGTVNADAATYAAARSGTGLVVDVGASEFDVGQVNITDSRYLCNESFVSFDTSAIADDDLVESVDLSLWTVNKNASTSFTAEAREHDWGVSLSTVDWVAGASLGGLTLMASKATASIVEGAYTVFTSEAAFVSAANLKSGFVHLLVCSSRHRSGNPPVNGVGEFLEFASAGASGTTQDPKLTITHADPYTPSTPYFTYRPNRVWRLH